MFKNDNRLEGIRALTLTVVITEMIAALLVFLLVAREALFNAPTMALLFFALKVGSAIFLLTALVARGFAFLYWLPLTTVFAQKGITDPHSFGKAGLVPGVVLIVVVLLLGGGFDTPDGVYSYIFYGLLFGSFFLAGYLGGRSYVKAMNAPPKESLFKDFTVKDPS